MQKTPYFLERKAVLFVYFLCMRKAEKYAGPLNDVLQKVTRELSSSKEATLCVLTISK